MPKDDSKRESERGAKKSSWVFLATSGPLLYLDLERACEHAFGPGDLQFGPEVQELGPGPGPGACWIAYLELLLPAAARAAAGARTWSVLVMVSFDLGACSSWPALDPERADGRKIFGSTAEPAGIST